MGILGWTWLIVGASFALYIGIAFWAQAKSTGDFYVAEKSIHPVLNGMATGADWMSRGVVHLDGRPHLVHRARRLALPDGLDRRLRAARPAPGALPAQVRQVHGPAVRGRPVLLERPPAWSRSICAIFVSFTYVAGQMRGVGIVFSRFLNTSINMGVVAGMVDRLLLRHLRRHEGHHLHAGRAVLRPHRRLPRPGDLHLGHADREPDPQLGYGSAISAGGAAILGVPEGTYLLDALNRSRRTSASTSTPPAAATTGTSSPSPSR